MWRFTDSRLDRAFGIAVTVLVVALLVASLPNFLMWFAFTGVVLLSLQAGGPEFAFFVQLVLGWWGWSALIFTVMDTPASLRTWQRAGFFFGIVVAAWMSIEFLTHPGFTDWGQAASGAFLIYGGMPALLAAALIVRAMRAGRRASNYEI